MFVERPETLDLMMRDQRALQQALQQAGLDASKTSLEFSLRQNPFGTGADTGQGSGSDSRRRLRPLRHPGTPMTYRARGPDPLSRLCLGRAASTCSCKEYIAWLSAASEPPVHRSALDHAAPGMADNFDTFLQILTTQLRNQNPLDPLDTNQFTQQLVQFSGVEQQLKTNQFLEAMMTSTQNANNSQAVSYIGKIVTA